MADNISVKDGGGVSRTLGAKDISSVHHPYNIRTDTSGNTTPAGDAAARPVICRLADGTTSQTFLDVDAAVDERTDHFMPTLAALFGYDGAASAGSRQVPLTVESTAAPNLLVGVKNGANQMPAGDAAARAIITRPSDGTTNMSFMDVDGAVDERLDYYMPTAAALMGTDSAASAGSKLVPVQVVSTAVPILKAGLYSSAGTALTVADTATKAAYLETAALVVTGPGEEVATASIVTGTTTPAATLAAVASTKYVIKSITISLACTLDQVPLHFQLRQDKAGTPVVLWEGALAGLAKTSSQIALTNLNIPMTVANKALHLEVVAGTIVSTNYITTTFTASRTA